MPMDPYQIIEELLPLMCVSTQLEHGLKDPKENEKATIRKALHSAKQNNNSLWGALKTEKGGRSLNSE